ncbi:hypothetical protein GCM10028806_34000 [Spirosoma terrae]|uniref:Uncharacterized protein n=1 Tax=Spirosoma terrae TaxID=1968276 RepID=A0A6L9LA77_9BACT|nr:hypothetical protein [Spirosoma terrae]NDU95713.1 hypothetical protein [Spirosoma terrae]
MNPTPASSEILPTEFTAPLTGMPSPGMEPPGGPDIAAQDWQDPKPQPAPSWHEPTLSDPAAPSVLTDTDRSNLMTQGLMNWVKGQNDEWQKDPVNAQAIAVRADPMSEAEVEETNRLHQNGFDFLRGRDNEAYANARQGFWGQLWNDTTMVGVNTLGTVGAWSVSLPTLIKTTKDLLAGNIHGLDAFTESMRGDEGSALRNINDWMTRIDESHQNFQSDWARQHPNLNLVPFMGEGGNDFGSLARSFGFLAGGLTTGLIETALLSAAAPLTEGASLGILAASWTNRLAKLTKGLSTVERSLTYLDDAYQAAKQAGRGDKLLLGASAVWNGIDTPIGLRVGAKPLLHSFLQANGEASLEGYQAERELYQQLLRDYRQRTGTQPDADQKAKFREAAKQAGNATFLLNHALLGVTNTFQLGTILKNFPQAQRLFGQADDLYRLQQKAGNPAQLDVVPNKPTLITFGANEKWYEKAFGKVATFARNEGKELLIGNSSEMLEEQFQKAISEGSQHYYQLQQSGVSKKDTDLALEAALHGLQQAFGTREGWTEGLGGLIVGRIGGGVSKYVVDRLNGPEQKARFEEIARQFNLSPVAVQEAARMLLERQSLGNSLDQKAQQAQASMNLTTLQKDAALLSDQFVFQNLKNSAQFHFLLPFVKQGSGDLIREQFKTWNETINQRPEEFTQAFGLGDAGSFSKEQLSGLVQGMDQTLRTLEKAQDRLSGLYKNPYRLTADASAEQQTLYRQWEDYYNEMLHAEFIRKAYTDRRQSLGQAISGSGSGLTMEDLTQLITPEGWRSRRVELAREKKTIEQTIDQERKALDLQQQASRPVAPENPDASHGVKVRQHAEETDRLTRELEADLLDRFEDRLKEIDQQQTWIEELESADFPLDKAVSTARQVLATSEFNVNLEDNEQTKGLLQQAHDAQALEAALKTLADRSDKLKSQRGFTDFVAQTEDFQRQKEVLEKAQQTARRAAQRQSLHDHISGVFANETERKAVLGNDLSDLIDTYLPQFQADEGATRTQLTTELTRQRDEHRRQQTERKQFLDDLLTDLKADNGIIARQSLDPGYVKLERKLKTVAAQENYRDAFTIFALVKEQYEAELPLPQPAPVAAPSPGPVTTMPTTPTRDPLAEEGGIVNQVWDQFVDTGKLPTASQEPILRELTAALKSGRQLSDRQQEIYQAYSDQIEAQLQAEAIRDQAGSSIDPYVEVPTSAPVEERPATNKTIMSDQVESLADKLGLDKDYLAELATAALQGPVSADRVEALLNDLANNKIRRSAELDAALAGTSDTFKRLLLTFWDQGVLTPYLAGLVQVQRQGITAKPPTPPKAPTPPLDRTLRGDEGSVASKYLESVLWDEWDANLGRQGDPKFTNIAGAIQTKNWDLLDRMSAWLMAKAKFARLWRVPADTVADKRAILSNVSWAIQAPTPVRTASELKGDPGLARRTPGRLLTARLDNQLVLSIPLDHSLELSERARGFLQTRLPASHPLQPRLGQSNILINELVESGLLTQDVYNALLETDPQTGRPWLGFRQSLQEWLTIHWQYESLRSTLANLLLEQAVNQPLTEGMLNSLLSRLEVSENPHGLMPLDRPGPGGLQPISSLVHTDLVLDSPGGAIRGPVVVHLQGDARSPIVDTYGSFLSTLVEAPLDQQPRTRIRKAVQAYFQDNTTSKPHLGYHVLVTTPGGKLLFLPVESPYADEQLTQALSQNPQLINLTDYFVAASGAPQTGISDLHLVLDTVKDKPVLRLTYKHNGEQYYSDKYVSASQVGKPGELNRLLTATANGTFHAGQDSSRKQTLELGEISVRQGGLKLDETILSRSVRIASPVVFMYNNLTTRLRVNSELDTHNPLGEDRVVVALPPKPETSQQIAEEVAIDIPVEKLENELANELKDLGLSEKIRTFVLATHGVSGGINPQTGQPYPSLIFTGGPMLKADPAAVAEINELDPQLNPEHRALLTDPASGLFSRTDSVPVTHVTLSPVELAQRVEALIRHCH